jgi:hypothetical protein
MPVMTLEQSQPYLQPLIDAAVSTLYESHGYLQQILNTFPDVHGKFDEWQKSGRMQYGVVGGVINLRFKKLTTELHSMNVVTGQQTQMYYQYTLPNFPELTQVTFGYIDDPIARQIAGIFFVCPKGFRANHWSWALLGGDGGSGLFGSGSTPPAPAVYDPDLDVTISANQAATESA